ncbi:MAG: hypothetical protein MJ232_04140 [archaeon]|nr:hypothetical protein [archaeon]
MNYKLLNQFLNTEKIRNYDFKEYYNNYLPHDITSRFNFEKRKNYIKSVDYLGEDWYLFLICRNFTYEQHTKVLFWWIKNNPETIELIIKKELKEEFISLMDEKPEFFEFPKLTKLGAWHITQTLNTVQNEEKIRMLNQFKLSLPNTYFEYKEYESIL